MTQPSTDRSVRKLRHSIQKRAYGVLMLGRGRPGLTQEQQVMVLDKQIELLNAALEKATEARKIVATRDFESYKAAKDTEKAKEAAIHDQLPASEETAMDSLAFEQLISQLAGDAPKAEAAEAAETKADDVPPF